MNDAVANVIANMKNAMARGHNVLEFPASCLVENFLNVLKNEGYIQGFEVKKRNNFSFFDIFLRYYRGAPVIREIRKVSKSGCRKYVKSKDILPFHNGLGVWILSTSRGILSDKQAKAANVGGEILCSVF